jgi:hypothetical protein
MGLHFNEDVKCGTNNYHPKLSYRSLFVISCEKADYPIPRFVYPRFALNLCCQDITLTLEIEIFEEKKKRLRRHI